MRRYSLYATRKTSNPYREQKMRRQYRDMENALAIAKGYRSDEEERETE